jgi:hypothetical protein
MEYVGRPYARNALVEIALMSALRNVVPDSETMRWVLRIAMSHYLKDDPTQMVCSELVYRILQEAQANPAGQLRPTIISAFRSHAALPPINAKALIKELEGIFYPKPPVAAAQPGAAAAPATAAARPTPIAVPVPVPVAAGKAAYESNEPASAELADLTDAIRAKHLPPQASAPVLIVPDPNPKTVFPVDLATSPSLRFIGRMQL